MQAVGHGPKPRLLVAVGKVADGKMAELIFLVTWDKRAISLSQYTCSCSRMIV